MSDQNQLEERLTVACLLSIAGGFLDIYSYLIRGHVFANAVTGNMVLLGLNLFSEKWLNCGRYLFAIFAYGAGILIANGVHEKMPLPRYFSWIQLVLLLEIAILLPVAFIPTGDWDLLVNTMISFVCAMQVQTFRRVHGLPFASTMCTGNLRSGTDALFHGLIQHNPDDIKNASHYFIVIAFFIFGAVTGAFILKMVSPYGVLVIPAILFVVFLIISSKKKT